MNRLLCRISSRSRTPRARLIKFCLFCSLSFLPVGCRSLPAVSYSAKVTVKVTDESGNPLPKAFIETDTFDRYYPASEWGGMEPRYKYVFLTTDKQGIAVAEVRLPHEDKGFGCKIVEYPGFYSGSAQITFTNTSFGRYLPWNPELHLVLQKIGVQSQTYACRVFLKEFPDENKPAGFDLMAGDWVAPDGKGKTADFIFHYEIKPTIYVTNSQQRFKTPITDWKRIISFSNDGDGIQTFESAKEGLHSPRQAPLEGYEPSLIQHEYKELLPATPMQETPTQFHKGYQPNRNYFFRVRTKKDEKGNIVSALYGKIYGDFNNGSSGEGTRKKISFTYYLNPEPNSRNMEFNLETNLLFKQAWKVEQELEEKRNVQNGKLDPEDEKECQRLRNLRWYSRPDQP